MRRLMRELIFGGVSCQPFAPAGRLRETLPQQFHELVVIKIAGRGDDHVSRPELAAVIRQDGLLIEAAYRVLGAQDRLAQRMALKEILRENLVHEVIGVVLVHLDLFQNHPTLARNLFAVEDWVQDHVAENIDGYRQMFIQNFNVEADGFLAREGVHVAADGIHLARDVLRSAVAGAFEHHVLNKMGDAVDQRILMPRSGLDPDAHRDRADVIHLFGQDGQAVGQDLALDVAQFFNHNYRSERYNSLRSARERQLLEPVSRLAAGEPPDKRRAVSKLDEITRSDVGHTESNR